MRSRKVIGIMMNTRALMELIVINVGFDLGVISQQRVHHAGADGHFQHRDYDAGLAALVACRWGVS